MSLQGITNIVCDNKSNFLIETTICSLGIRILRLVFCIFLTILTQSCQHQISTNTEKNVEIQRHKTAAAYNTQLGIAYLKQGNTSRAKRKLLNALKLDPNSPDANAAMAYFNEKTGNIPEATEYYKKALLSSSNNGSQLNNYGTFLCRQKKYKEAEEYFLKAVNDRTYLHTAGAYENAGLCTAAMSEEAKAMQYFVKALEQDPGRKQSLAELVRLQLKNNRPENALFYLEKYKRITLKNSDLLAIAIKIAHKTGKAALETEFKTRRLSMNTNYTYLTGDDNEYNRANG